MAVAMPDRDRSQGPSGLSGLLVAAGTLVFAFLVVLGEQAGMPRGYALHLTGFLVLVVVGAVAVRARTLSVADWLLAGRGAGSVANGMALAASLITGWTVVALGGLFFADPGAGVIWLIGPLIGLAFAAFLIAPYLRRSGAATPAEFITRRFDSRAAGRVMALAAVAAALLTLWSQLLLTSALIEALWAVERRPAVVAAALMCGLAVLPGGLGGVIRVNAVILGFLATAYLVPLVWPSLTLAGFPVPQLAFGHGALEAIGAVAEQLGVLAIAPFDDRVVGVVPAGASASAAVIMTLVLGAGLCAMPHVLAHFAAARGPAGARLSAGWALVLVALVLTGAPALAAFAKLGLYNNLLGLAVGDIRSGAEWLLTWGSKPALAAGGPMATLCGAAVTDTAAAIAACGGNPDYVIAPPDIRLSAETVTLAMPQIVGLPAVLGAMIAVAALAAGLATANAAAAAIGATVARDLFAQDDSRPRPASRVLFLCRLAAAAALVLAAWLTAQFDPPAVIVALWAVAIGAAVLAPVIVAAAWWHAMTANGALAGIAGGGAVLAACAAAMLFGPDLLALSGDEPRLAVPGLDRLPSAVQGAVLALPVATALIVAGSAASRAAARPDRLDSIHRPGGTPLVHGPDN
ncbi:MAG: hypothetical protein BroJett030_16400 [Alphaproteobacteria bacterium]|nr:MAG: hypothetical protein BroJett030_16400 [Alphaproteobacteria bacterium]